MSAVVAGNWKMYHGPKATADFFDRLDAPRGVRMMVFPPSVSLHAAVSHPRRPATLELGVQSIHEADQGAFTGEISGTMALEAGATLTLVGHSERRQLFGEDDDRVARKVSAALRAGLTPVVCVGETLDERRAGRLEEVLLRQLDAVLPHVGPGTDWLVAYEPVWAIGTGETATPDDAAEAHRILLDRLAEGGWPEGRVPVLYGGSVKPGNAAELLAAPGVGGVLVGGASLDPDDFAAIARAATR